VGKKPPYILIDTGEGREDYIPFLEKALVEEGKGETSKQLVSDIVISHKHHDHTEGLPSVLALLKRLWSNPNVSFPAPRIHKFPHSPVEDSAFTTLIGKVYGETSSPSNGPFHLLKDKQVLKGEDSTLQVVHSPGHTTDSICLLLPEEKALFTADSVLGQGTSVFEDLGSYMKSLESLLELKSRPESEYLTVYPGHGPVVEDRSDGDLGHD
jgi:glyoxylase-like metal-dependent hydrolase (beta-lactamase superfamily II)